MKFILISALLILVLTFRIEAQADTTKTDDLLNDLISDSKDTDALLPDHFLITQRILWGEKGLMRNFERFELTPVNRQNELKIRRVMLVTHQIGGFITLGGMIAQGIVGVRLYNGANLKDTHEALAGLVNTTYFTTAGLSLFAPPGMLNERKGYSSVKLHKALAIVHFSSMVAVNVLASQLESNPGLRPYHRAAAYTAFGSFAAAMIVIKF